MKKRVIVTGASRGIGRATALLFAEKGYDILVCCRENLDAATEVCHAAASFGARAIPFAADVASPAECRRIVSKAMLAFGGVDVLVNNAGVALPKLFLQTEEADFDRLTDTDYKGVFFLSQAVAKEMVAVGFGTIINVSSMWGLVGSSGEVAYSAAKAAVIGLTKALAKELAPSGIRVNAVAPGVIDTDMNACYDKKTMQTLAERTPLSRLGTPEDVARAILFLTEDTASFITGQVLTVDGGFAG